jgi:hypothetical protein
MRALVLALALVAGLATVALAASHQKRFETMDDAVNALISAFRTEDKKALAEILGPEGRTVVSSGDDVADRLAYRKFVAEYDRAHRLEAGGGKVVLYVGDDDFPLPIPLVPDGPSWRWDTAAAKEEILSRRIGRNELGAIQVCLAYVDAQREYYAEAWSSDGVLQYAPRLASNPGKRDGLYWDTKPGEKPSPLGVLLARARSEGYVTGKTSGGAAPYHGYLYRTLPGQGPSASGGAYDYVVEGRMIGGFGLLAFPAQYGVSGIMTFMVNHDGVVYQKNLGPNTAQLARQIKTFDPDSTWQKVESAAARP